VKATGAAVAAVLLLGGGFGAGWAAASTRPNAVPAGWDQGRDMPGFPGDGPGRDGDGPGAGIPDGDRGDDGDRGPRPRSDSDSDSGSDSDSDADSGSGADDS
jgi:hypothetical protein